MLKMRVYIVVQDAVAKIGFSSPVAMYTNKNTSIILLKENFITSSMASSFLRFHENVLELKVLE